MFNISSGKEGCTFLVRLFQFVPGDVLDGKPYTVELCFEVGQLTGRLSNVLKVKVQSLLAPLFLKSNVHLFIKARLSF
jgi:Ser/Thr protein kinase RdoA (MazF antagonist)